MKNSKKKRTDYELQVSINLLEECNYNCAYCYVPYRCEKYKPIKDRLYKIKEKFKNSLLRRKKLIQLDNDKIFFNIQKLNKKTFISLDGGEPFLFPKFIDLCKLLTKKYDIQIFTNLSQKSIYRFANEINPDKIFLIICSFHIAEIEKYNSINDFIEKVKYLKNKNFPTLVTSVMYPPFFKKFLYYHKLFKLYNLNLIPRIFEGVYKSKIYPQSYTCSQKNLIYKFIKYNPKISHWNTWFGDNNFKGNKCFAGKSKITIHNDGTVYRCYGDKKYLGHISKGNIQLFKSAKECKSNKCSCPSSGYNLLVKKDNEIC